MEAYFEFTFLEQFFIFLILIVFSDRLSHQKSKERKYISALIGTIFTIYVSCHEYTKLITYCLKLLIGLLVSLISYRGRRTFYYCGSYFLLSTALAGIGTLFPYGKNTVFCSSLVLWIISIVLRKRTKYETVDHFFCQCVIEVGAQNIKLNGYIDTGNMIFYKGEPVHLIQREKFIPLMLSGRIKKIGKTSYSVVGGTGVLELWEVEKLQVYFGTKIHTIEKSIFGICDKLSEDYQILLNPSCMREEYETERTALTHLTKVEY